MKHLLIGMALAGTILLLTTPAVAQNHYPLQIIRPLPVGPAGTGLDAGNRIYKAYQGIPYSIIATAIGGRWPYTFSLSGQPTGMTIEAGPCTTIGPSCTAGTISWPNPQVSEPSVTVQICDADNDCTSQTWSITVSTTIGAHGFCFINADSGNDTTGNGSLANPWRTFARGIAACGTHAILYFRGATASYTLTSVPITTGTCLNGKAEIHENLKPVIWLAYPGESPVLDLDVVHADPPCLRLTGENIWIDGITFRDGGNKVFETSRPNRYGATYIRNTFNTWGPGVESQNPAAIMYSQLFGGGGVPNTQAYYDVVSHNTFINGVTNLASALRMYSWLKGTVEFNRFTSIVAAEAIAIKGDISQYTVRGNTFNSITGSAIWGNMHQATDPTYGEIYFNHVRDSTQFALQLNQGATNGPTHVYRNTFQGRINIWNGDSVDGPFFFTHNVIVNGGGSGGSCPPRLNCYQTTNYSRIILSGNLQGPPSDGIVNASGELQGSYRNTWIGLRGVELSASSGTGGGDTDPPQPPQNLRLTQ